MILTREQIKQIVQDYFKDKPVKKAYLFGSYATGDANEESDVDILYQLEEGTRMDYFKLARYLLDLEDRLHKNVDLVSVDLLREDRVISKFIREQKVLLYARPD